MSRFAALRQIRLKFIAERDILDLVIKEIDAAIDLEREFEEKAADCDFLRDQVIVKLNHAQTLEIDGTDILESLARRNIIISLNADGSVQHRIPRNEISPSLISFLREHELSIKIALERALNA